MVMATQLGIPLDDVHKRMLQYVFQASPPGPDDVIYIYLNTSLVYTTSKAVISRYPSSVMWKSLQADMSESMTNQIVIQDEEGLYTISAVKLLFAALTVGSAAIEHSIFTSYDTLVVPFLAHYLGVDEDETGKQIGTIALAQCQNSQYSVEDINNIILKLLPTATMYADSSDGKSFANSFFASFKKLLVLRLADQASSSTNHYIYNWEYLSPDDLVTVAQNIKGVTLCTYRCALSASGACTCEYVSGLEGSETLISIVPKLVEGGKRFCIHMTWENDQPQCYFFSVTTNMMSQNYFPATRASCGTWRQCHTTGVDPVYVSIYRHAWQMRYEIIMAYIRQSCNMRMPDEFHISEHVGMQWDMCLRGIIALRSLEGDTTALRNMIIETTALMLRICFMSDFNNPSNSLLIAHLTSMDVVDIVSCEAFASFTELSAKSYVFDVLKFAVMWKNAAPNSTNPDRPPVVDAIAVVKLIVKILNFTDVTMGEKLLNEKNRFVEWLTAYAGDELQPQVQTIIETLSKTHLQADTNNKSLFGTPLPPSSLNSNNAFNSPSADGSTRFGFNQGQATLGFGQATSGFGARR